MATDKSYLADFFFLFCKQVDVFIVLHILIAKPIDTGHCVNFLCRVVFTSTECVKAAAGSLQENKAHNAKSWQTELRIKTRTFDA